MQLKLNKYHLLLCPRSSEPFNIVSYYIKWVTTSRTHSISNEASHRISIYCIKYLCFKLTPISYCLEVLTHFI